MTLEQEMLALAPWHMTVQVTPDLSTGAGRERGGAERQSPEERAFRATLGAVYPGGLAGRRFLDAACNCGGYSFWAKELGAAACFGFDVREHWIRQAEFLRRHRTMPSDGVTFAVHHLGDLGALKLAPFEVSLFKGIFYHLPDPIGGLKIVADLTTELLIVNTATRASTRQGLVMAAELKDPLLNGVDGLNWYPTSPAVMEGILRWMGFREFRLQWWQRRAPLSRGRGIAGWLRAMVRGAGRLQLLAARTPGFFDAYDRAPESSRNIR